MKSRSDTQLRGDGDALSDTSDCSPEQTLNGNSSQVIRPCGLVAWSYFNDTYTVRCHLLSCAALYCAELCWVVCKVIRPYGLVMWAYIHDISTLHACLLRCAMLYVHMKKLACCAVRCCMQDLVAWPSLNSAYVVCSLALCYGSI